MTYQVHQSEDVALKTAAEKSPLEDEQGWTGRFQGETHAQAALHWAEWCEVRHMAGLPRLLRDLAALLEQPVAYMVVVDSGFFYFDTWVDADWYAAPHSAAKVIPLYALDQRPHALVARDQRELANLAHAQAEHYRKTGEALPGFSPAEGSKS